MILGFSPLILFAIALPFAFIPATPLCALFLAIAGVVMFIVVLITTLLFLADGDFRSAGKLMAITAFEVVLICGASAVFSMPFDWGYLLSNITIVIES